MLRVPILIGAISQAKPEFESKLRLYKNER